MADSILRSLLAGTSKPKKPAIAPSPLPSSTGSKPAAATLSGARLAAQHGTNKSTFSSAAHTQKPAAHRVVDSDDDDDNESGDELELIAGRGAATSKHSSSSKEHATASGSNSSSSAELQRMEEVRAFRKRLGIKISGNGVVDPYEHFYAIPEILPSEVASHVAAVSCVRFQPAPTTKPSSNTADAAVSSDRGDTGKKDKKQKGDRASSAPPASVPLATVLSQAQSRHAAVRRSVLANIEKSAYAEPLPVQMQALPALLAGRDAMAIAPTGSGKTAAFALPLILSLQGHSPVGPRALIITPTKELAAQTQREVLRLCEGTGLRCSVLTRVTASAVAGGKVSATADAADLVKQHGKKRQRGSGGDGSRRKGKKKARRASDSEGSEEEAGDEDDIENDDEEASDDDDDGDQSDAEDSEERDNGADLSDDDDNVDDEDEALAVGSGGGKRVWKPREKKAHAPAPPLSFTRSVVAPPLPRVDILIATPLLLVSLLRHAQHQAAPPNSISSGAAKKIASTNASDSDSDSDSEKNEVAEPPLPKVILPSLRCITLDEADKLLELGFLEQVDSIFDARPDVSSLTAYVSEEGREVAERRAQLLREAGSSSSGLPSAASLDARERELRLLAGAVGVPVPTPLSVSAAAYSPTPSISSSPSSSSATSSSSSAAIPSPASVPVCVSMFSATMPSGIEELAMTVLTDPLR